MTCKMTRPIKFYIKSRIKCWTATRMTGRSVLTIFKSSNSIAMLMLMLAFISVSSDSTLERLQSYPSDLSRIMSNKAGPVLERVNPASLSLKARNPSRCFHHCRKSCDLGSPKNKPRVPETLVAAGNDGFIPQKTSKSFKSHRLRLCLSGCDVNCRIYHVFPKKQTMATSNTESSKFLPETLPTSITTTPWVSKIRPDDLFSGMEIMNLTSSRRSSVILENWNLRQVSLVLQKFLVIADLKWNAVYGAKDYLVTWELNGGGLKGHLVTDSTTVTLSLWPDTVYSVQVELFGDGRDGENPNSDLVRKSFPVSVNTSEASFRGLEDEVEPMAGALRERQKESSHKSVTEFLNVALGTGSFLVFILLPLGVFMFCRGRIQRKVQGSSKHLWLLDYLEDGGAGETVSGHGDKPNKITTTIHDRGCNENNTHGLNITVISPSKCTPKQSNTGYLNVNFQEQLNGTILHV